MPRKLRNKVLKDIEAVQRTLHDRKDHSKSGTQTLSKIVIPSTSSIASSLSSLRGQSSDYDTPATSNAVTPADPLSKRFDITSNLDESKDGSGSHHGLGQEWSQADTYLVEGLPKPERVRSDRAHGLQNRKRLSTSKTDVCVFKSSLVSGYDDSESDGATRLTKKAKIESMPRHRDIALSQDLRQTATVSSCFQESDELDISERSDASMFALDSADTCSSDDSEQSAEDEQHHSHDRGDENVISDLAGATTTSTVGDPSSHHRTSRRRNSRRALHRRRGQQFEGSEDRTTRERKKLEKAHPEIITMWDTLKDVAPLRPGPRDQPLTITRKLKSFQLEGLSWMIAQERTQWKGGLLGDEMGMGKTIQAVSLIMSDYPAANPTLVIVPPVALMQWQNEIKDYTDGKLRVLVYHNTNPKVKNLKIKELQGYDVIMISYSGLESIYRKESKGWKREDVLIKEKSKIHAIHYHRLILDEAHNIKSRTSSCAKACFALSADYKWCLSGTPVQNRIGEFFSLLRFLQIKPFACYFCKKCSCRELHWTQDESKRCASCQHTGFEHVSVFNQELLNPITQGDDPALRRSGLAKLRLITDRIMLRRMKKDHTASMELPPKEVIIHNEFFGEIERDFSSSIMSNTTRTFDTYVSRGVMLNNYANIFGLIMQMRQVANHPDLILKKHAQGGQNVLVCSICDETAEEPIRSRCHHEFCRKCARDYVNSFEDETPDCPRCHIPINIDFDQPDIEQDEDNVRKSSIINRIKMEDWTSSTKIEMLVYDLYKLRSRKQSHKSIVFSQFTSMLQLVEWRLRRAGFNTVMLDGSMSPAQRQKSIEYFMNNIDVEVFLVSLKAGGIALNLTEASRVFIIDP